MRKHHPYAGLYSRLLTAAHQAADLTPVHDNQPFGRQPA
nr:MAG TPA: hypothetical protein [Caudoviricetes sp.]